MSRRTALAGFVVALVAGFVTLAVAAGRTSTTQHFTLGDFPAQELAIVGRHDVACQGPLALPDAIDRVTMVIAPSNEVRGPVVIRVRALATPAAFTGPVLATGRQPRHRLSGVPEVTQLDRTVPSGRYVAVCVTQTGREPIEVWGQTGPQTPARSRGYVNGTPIAGDLFIDFPRHEPASVGSRLPEALRHAAPFKLGGVGSWLYWVLAVLGVLGVPAGLGYALRRAAGADADSDARARS